MTDSECLLSLLQKQSKYDIPVDTGAVVSKLIDKSAGQAVKMGNAPVELGGELVETALDDVTVQGTPSVSLSTVVVTHGNGN